MKLSVIIPVHNGEEYIGRCVNNIMSAINVLRNDEAELIVINDGSEDGTHLRIKELLLHNPEIKYQITEDKGVSASRNLGIRVAEGEYVSFVDSDDIVKPDMFVKLLKIAEETDADVVGCGFFKWSDDNVRYTAEVGNPMAKTEYVTYVGQEFINAQITNGNSRCWSKIYKKELAQEIGFRESLSIGEDMVFLSDCAMQGASFVELTNYEGYGYYLNPHGAINRAFTPKYMDQIKCWEILLERVTNENAKTAVTRNLVVAIMLVASKIARLGSYDRKKNREYVKSCYDKLVKIVEDTPGIINVLDKGYQIKTRMFIKSPDRYMFLYHLWK